MNKKVLTWLIVAAVIIIAGGLGYYKWQASADAFSQQYCAGTTGAAWKNCTQNMATWKKFMASHSNSHFKKYLN